MTIRNFPIALSLTYKKSKNFYIRLAPEMPKLSNALKGFITLCSGLHLEIGRQLNSGKQKKSKREVQNPGPPLVNGHCHST
jgi:hypothetical protein